MKINSKKIKHFIHLVRNWKVKAKKKVKLDSNVTLQKRKLFPLTLEERLNDSPSIFAEIPADRVKGIEAAKHFFSNTTKHIPPES